ncbi:MAG: ATP-dependent Clp protease ATP-binding subunit ClpX [Clostridiales bacterium]|nr:ATP-dependent Clp protease ATP-binding subunit ClpX [Clostridiales bacterium]
MNSSMDDKNEYEKFCMFCGRSEDTAGKMIEIPGGICVCRDCIQKAFDTLSSTGLSQADAQRMAEQFVKDAASSVSGGGDENKNENKNENENAGGSSENADLTVDDGNAETADENTGAEDENSTDDSGRRNFHIPSISLINLGDLFGNFGMPRAQQQIRKKPKEKQPQKELDIAHIPAPHKIKESLDEYVVGQEHAKKVISVAVYNHYKRITDFREQEERKNQKDNRDDEGNMLTDTQLSERSSVLFDDVEIEKSNMLLLGPTGCGKTYLVKTLARLLDVPLAIADATSLTEAGYIGDDIESVVTRLLTAADNDVARAEQGIIFIDEIDKIARRENAHQRDVSGEAVQQGMLKLLEGSEIEVPVGSASKNAMVPMATVDTSNILFICGGAFPGLEEIIKERLNRQASIGFFSDLKDKYDDDPDLLMKVEVEDLRQFGMIPEFLGRLPIICSLQSLTKEMLVRILKEPRNAIVRQYQKLLALDEVELQFDDGALEAIAEKAIKRKTGARALRAIIEEFMLDIMYEIPKDDSIGTVRITREYIEHTGGPVISLRNAAQ